MVHRRRQRPPSSRTATARSTPRRRSSSSSDWAGSGPTPCCRTSCRRSCTAPARTRCRTCGRSPRALARLDLDALAATRRSTRTWARRRPPAGGAARRAATARPRCAAAVDALRDGAGIDGLLDAVVDRRDRADAALRRRPASSTSTTTSAGSTSPTADLRQRRPLARRRGVADDTDVRAAGAVDACSWPTGPGATSGTPAVGEADEVDIGADRPGVRRRRGAAASGAARRHDDGVHRPRPRREDDARRRPRRPSRLGSPLSARRRRRGSWRRPSWSGSSPPPSPARSTSCPGGRLATTSSPGDHPEDSPAHRHTLPRTGRHKGGPI